MVTRDQIEKGIASYLDTEFLPQIHTYKWKEVAIATAVAVMVKRTGTALDALKNNPVLSALGIVDCDGNYDIEIIAEEAKNNMPAEGLKVPLPLIGNMTLHQSDIDNIFGKIKGM